MDLPPSNIPLESCSYVYVVYLSRLSITELVYYQSSIVGKIYNVH